MKSVGLSLMAILLVAPALHGQVEVETEFGFDGYYYPDSPTPIQVLVRGQGPPLQGRIIVSQEVKSPWQGAVEERLVRPFGLPGKSEKLFHFNFPLHGYIYPLSITIVAGDEIIYEKEIELKRRFLEERLTLVIGESPFPGGLPTGERPIQIEPESLPPRWPGLLGVRRIYLGRLNPSSLSRAQRQALVRWIEWGGELVVLGGDNWWLQDSPYLRGLLPFEPWEVGERAGLPVVLGKPRGEVLYQQEDLPILIAGRRGRGRVIFSTINPLDGSVGEEFWEPLSGGRTWEGPDGERLRLAAELLGGVRLPFPSKFTLIGIYSLYIGGLALLGRIALHRQWLILLIPLWIAGTMVLIARYIDRPQFAKPLIGLELGMIHDLGETALHSSWLGLFAKADAELELPVDVGDGYLLQAIPKERGDHLYDADYLPDRGRMRVSFRMAEWRGRAFYLERFAEDLASLKVMGERVMVKNLSRYTLRDCLLFDKDKGKLYAIGDIGSYGTIEREAGPEVGRPEERFLARLYSLAQEELLGPQALLCTSGLEGFPLLPMEERLAAGLVLIEEDP